MTETSRKWYQEITLCEVAIVVGTVAACVMMFVSGVVRQSAYDVREAKAAAVCDHAFPDWGGTKEACIAVNSVLVGEQVAVPCRFLGLPALCLDDPCFCDPSEGERTVFLFHSHHAGKGDSFTRILFTADDRRVMEAWHGPPIELAIPVAAQ